MTEETPLDIDADGKCLYHPQIHLQRRVSSGGWRKVLSRCPLCSISPPRPVKDASFSSRRSTFKSDPSSSRGSFERSTLGRESSDSFNPLISSCEKDFSNLSMTSTDVTVASTSASSISSTSEDRTFSSFNVLSASSSRRSSLSALITKDIQSPTSSPSASPSISSSTSRSTPRKSVVCGMRYLCPDKNLLGSYTGQLNPETQLPHGVGCLRFKDGTLADGDWFNGRLFVPAASSSQRHGPVSSTTTRRHSEVNSECPLPPLPLTRHKEEHHIEDDSNSLDGNDDYSMASGGDASAYSHETKRSYSARETKSPLPPAGKASSYRRHSAEYPTRQSQSNEHERRRHLRRSFVEVKGDRISQHRQDLTRLEE